MNAKYVVVLLDDAREDFLKLGKNNKPYREILMEAMQKLQEINIPEALHTNKIKQIKGFAKGELSFLEDEGYLPVLFEYRDFPKSIPLRLVFAVNKKSEKVLILRAFHHKMMERIYQSIRESL